jgi:hypothetical protein
VEWGMSAILEVDTGAPDVEPVVPRIEGIGRMRIFAPLSGPWDWFYVPKQTRAEIHVHFRPNAGTDIANHALEVSTNLVDWFEIRSYETEFIGDLILTNDVPARFYRMRRLCE